MIGGFYPTDSEIFSVVETLGLSNKDLCEYYTDTIRSNRFLEIVPWYEDDMQELSDGLDKYIYHIFSNVTGNGKLSLNSFDKYLLLSIADIADHLLRDYAKRLYTIDRVDSRGVQSSLHYIATYIAACKFRLASVRDSSSRQNELVPDVLVVDKEGVVDVVINKVNFTRIRLSAKAYDENISDDVELREAKLAIWAIERRNRLLCSIAKTIITKHSACINNYENAITLISYADIANELGTHIYTVISVIKNCTILIDRNVVDLNSFFDATDSTSIHHLVKQLIISENSRKPHTDQRIADIISKNGLSVTRIEIKKAREVLEIAAAEGRRRLF